MRKAYLDNIRWATVLLVLFYHVCYMFNGVGIFGGIPGADSISAFDVAACVIYPWFMVLLFIVSGMSARYSLQKRTAKQFIKERAVKLLVPSTLGLFVIHWITGYLNIKMGGGLAYIPPMLVYPISVISGTGPLWFIQMLFVFSCVLILIRKIDKNDKLWNLCGKINTPIVLLLFLLIFLAAQVLNMPVITTYRFGIYFAAFCIGYYIFSHDEIIEKISNIRIPMIFISAAGIVLYAVYYYKSNFTSSECLQSIITNAYLWAVILTVFGCAKKYFDRETPFTKYMTKSSFGIYILHYPVLIIICYLLNAYCTLPSILNYIIAFVLDVVLTFGAYELLKRIPVIRYLVLGIKRTPKA